MKAEEIYAITPDENGWRKLPNGNYVILGNDVRLGDYVSLGDGVTSLALAEQIRGFYSGMIRATKWVTKARMSPNFDGGTPIAYPRGAIVEAEGTADDQQCGPGLHVLRLGYRPEWCWLCEPDHKLIPLTVEFEAADILFAGLPGNDAKWRVRKLKMVD